MSDTSVTVIGPILTFFKEMVDIEIVDHRLSILILHHLNKRAAAKSPSLLPIPTRQSWHDRPNRVRGSSDIVPMLTWSGVSTVLAKIASSRPSKIAFALNPSISPPSRSFRTANPSVSTTRSFPTRLPNPKASKRSPSTVSFRSCRKIPIPGSPARS